MEVGCCPDLYRHDAEPPKPPQRWSTLTNRDGNASSPARLRSGSSPGGFARIIFGPQAGLSHSDCASNNSGWRFPARHDLRRHARGGSLPAQGRRRLKPRRARCRRGITGCRHQLYRAVKVADHWRTMCRRKLPWPVDGEVGVHPAPAVRLPRAIAHEADNSQRTQNP